MAKKQVRILVSACLLGACCRYDGGSNGIPELSALSGRAELVPFCPEIYGGLATPRKPAEIRGGNVVTADGTDVTDAFRKGAKEALAMVRRLDCTAALLKERSPSCGSGMIYDGTFSGIRVEGKGVTAGVLDSAGIPVFSEEKLTDLLIWLGKEEEEC